jgi:hypothetical protein
MGSIALARDVPTATANEYTNALFGAANAN